MAPNSTPPKRSTVMTGVFVPTRYAVILIAAVLWMSALQIKDLTQAYTEIQRKNDGNALMTSSHYVESKSVLRNPKDNQQCRFYFAESAVAEKSGMGVFSAVGLHKGEDISFPDICIFVSQPPRRWTHLHSHTWGWGTYFGQFEGAHSRAACEGVHTTYNTMPDRMINTRIISPVQPTTAGVTRSKPGAGAITHHYGIRSEAVTTVEAGQELTIFYGDWEFEGDPLFKPQRKIEDLAENGWCIDHIEIKQSTIDGAGRGLFTKRSLSKGTVLTPAPLQVFSDRTIFPKVNGREQLYINYCMQPEDSNMMVYPYGPGVNLINHSKQPNVGWRWSDKSLHHGEFLEMELKEFWHKTWPGGLVLEVYALRELFAGEELFLDYGDAWQQAWDEHVASWESPEDADQYVYPEQMDDTQTLRTVTEQEDDPYPSSVMTMCFTPLFEREPGSTVEWYEPEDAWGQSNMVYCHILDRSYGDDGTERYTVELIWFHYNSGKALTESDLRYYPKKPNSDRYFDTNVPRRAIKWNEKPFNDDEHLKNAFRHPIGFPSELWPKLWVDSK